MFESVLFHQFMLVEWSVFLQYVFIPVGVAKVVIAPHWLFPNNREPKNC
jgi:hypothetical protein